MADQAADEAAIREVVKQANAAFNKHNAKAMADLDVETIESWDGKHQGRKQLSEWYASMKGQYNQNRVNIYQEAKRAS